MEGGILDFRVGMEIKYDADWYKGGSFKIYRLFKIKQ